MPLARLTQFLRPDESPRLLSFSMNQLQKLADNPRVTVRRGGMPDPDGACVVYWMQRAQRGVDHPALDIAVEAANELAKPVVVFFAPLPFYPHANLRHYRFLNDGIPDIADALQKRNVGFILRHFPEHSLLQFCDEVKAALVIGDENPMRDPESWRRKASKQLRVPLWTVDSDTIVPSRLLDKAQYSAHIIRSRLQAKLPSFLVASKNPKARIVWKKPLSLSSLSTDSDITLGWRLDRSVDTAPSWHGGSKEALRVLDDFISNKLRGYSTLRNKPEVDHTSRLSPYLHFGHISPIRIALAAQRSEAPKTDKAAFLDQIITWRELSINLVRFNPEYDNFECGEPWAHRTLAKHAKDPRAISYSEEQLENAETHDPLWNAAQTQMVHTGWMHNYMRMYWAKKILEWSASPAEAYRIAIYLNDKYELDGRDPNGYAGIAWSIVGKFDRPWFERPIFGQIRYMSAAGADKKFDTKKYIEQNLSPGLFG